MITILGGVDVEVLYCRRYIKDMLGWYRKILGEGKDIDIERICWRDILGGYIGEIYWENMLVGCIGKIYQGNILGRYIEGIY